MKWQRKLDDLDDGDKIEIDTGDTLLRGRYGGLYRIDLEGTVRWYIVTHDKDANHNRME